MEQNAVNLAVIRTFFAHESILAVLFIRKLESLEIRWTGWLLLRCQKSCAYGSGYMVILRDYYFSIRQNSIECGGYTGIEGCSALEEYTITYLLLSYNPMKIVLDNRL